MYKTEKDKLCIDSLFFQIYNKQNESEFILELL